MDTTTKKNLTDTKTWMRLVYIILFAIAFNVAEAVFAAVVVVQFVFHLFTGQANNRLRALGRDLSTYVFEIVAYLTYHTDDKPFPFRPWPAGAPANDPAETKPAEAKPARARRRRTSKASTPAKRSRPAASK